MNRTEGDLKVVNQQIRALEERKIYLSSELAQLSPESDVISVRGVRVLGPRDRLKELQTEFIALSSRYSSTHPDLKKIKKEIAALREEVGTTNEIEELRAQVKALKTQKAVLTDKYSPEHPDVKNVDRSLEKAEEALKKSQKAKSAGEGEGVFEPDNPAYIQIQSQLEAANSELKSLRELRQELLGKVRDYEERLIKSPQVEREYRNLSRDYDNAIAKYKEVKAKQLEAELAEALERENKGERFSLVEPPLIPEEPSKPNRLAILFLGFIFSLAGGVGTVAVAEALSDSIKGVDGLMQITGVPALIAIPYIEVAEEKEKQAEFNKMLLIGGAVAFVLVVILFHFLVKPLDVLWFVFMRVIGFGV
jgi:uncharacterized protein involved in exopolysaccharide biosynthesis